MKTSQGLSFTDHSRDREGGRLVYPVLARRSGGLSLGINLFPDRKLCSFDCPYCEVFPSSTDIPFSPRGLESELEAFVAAEEASPGHEAIRDICLSGNGEPSLSPWLGEALEICAAVRRRHGSLLEGTKLVLITNSTGFLVPDRAALLHRYVETEGLEVWAKLDAGDEAGFASISGSSYRLADILGGLASFASTSPVVVQTMVCALDGRDPDQEGLGAYARAIASLLAGGARIGEIHLYTQARPSPGGRTSALSDPDLLEAGAHIKAGIARALGREASPQPALRIFGSGGELGPAPAQDGRR